VDASSIGHDLSRGVAHFSRTRRAPGETAAESAEAPAAPPSPDGGEQDGPACPPGRDGSGPDADPAADEEAGTGGAGGNGAGGGVLDDGAVAGFASEMSRSLEGAPA
jgi:hypothetical protein